MKKLPLLLFMLSAYVTSFGDYFPGQRNISQKAIPGLIQQLKNSKSATGKIDLMLNLGFGYMFKPGEEKADMDSAMYYAQQTIALSRKINNTSFTQEGMLLTAMIFVEQRALASAKKISYSLNDTNRAKIMLCISKHCFLHEQIAPGDYSHLDSTLYYAQSAIKIASATKHVFLLSAALNWSEQVGDHCENLDLYSVAEKNYLFMLDYCNNKSSPTKAAVYSLLGHLSIDDGDFYQALNYGLKAEKALHSNSSDYDFAVVNSHLGSIYKFIDKYDKGLVYYGKILKEPHRYRKFVDIYSIAASYCYCLRRLGRNDETILYLQDMYHKYPPQTELEKSHYHSNLANAYKEQGLFKPAEEHFSAAIKLNKSSAVAVLYSHLGALYDKFNYPEKTIATLKAAEKIFIIKNDVIQATNLRLMAKSEAVLGNYKDAYEHLLKSKSISDSIYDVSKEKHTQELEIQYQTQKRETDLRLKEENIRFLNQHAELMAQDSKLQKAKLKEASLLAEQKENTLQLKEKNIEILTNNAKLQHAEIEQAESKRKITVLVIILLGVIIALLVWLFWSKLRSNKIITDKNGLLQQLLTDKSWLVKEMHHRVKNNLHTVMSLLESQSVYLRDDALEAVKNSQCRIFSMSLIHQKLYQEDVVKTIDMECYIPELISYLRECFNLPGSFRIHMDIDPAEFDVSEAVPLGLIINEAVTNSLKYAHGGEINISLKITGIHEYELTMADDGIGLRENFDIDNVTSLGFKLIKGLSDQLEAKLSIANENGLKIKLSGISIYNPTFNKQLTA